MLLAALVGCVHDDWKAPPERPVVPGAPLVGAAEGFLKLPLGTPLSGYTARCTAFGGFGRVDDRKTPYNTSFTPSAGVQTYPTIKVIWLSNGDDDLVITKTDSIYSADELVTALTARLEADTGLDLKGKVVHTADHSHSSFGDYAHGAMWYLGSDKFNSEILARMVDQIAVVAEEAHDAQQPGKIGVGWAVDWDPADEVYHDRRGENDALAPWGADGPQGLGKDPHLGVVRFDTLDDEPIALMMNFGMHGTIGSEENALVSGDSGAHLEIGVDESFGDKKVVSMFVQGSGGDVSPSTREGGFAADESVGIAGADKIRALYDSIETSADPIRMETVSRAIYKHPSIMEITRGGTVDLKYAPYDPALHADDKVYADDGSILSPLDEFNTDDGAAFCGSGDIPLDIGKMLTSAFPYNQCVLASALAPFIQTVFGVDDELMQLPFRETLKASTTTSRIGPVPTLRADGTEVSEDWFVGFFPGEPVYSFGEQWRRRTKAELGIDDAMIVGYSQDHEGYLLIPEDWLVGGYEPDIGVYGPLEAEFIMEQVLDYSKELLTTTDVREDPDPLGQYQPTTYPEEPLPTVPPDPTPDAGKRITNPSGHLWTPFLSGTDAPTAQDLQIPAQIPRVQGLVQIAWEGGDAMVDSPNVVLERQDGASWTPVTTAAGRVIDESRPDILLSWTPTPLGPPESLQTHQWWAAWQAVSHWEDREGLPLGTYRLHVTGTRYAGTATHWPWDGAPYEVTSEPFEVVPGVVSLTVDGGGILASLKAPPHGYRLIDIAGSESGDNPIAGPVHVEIEAPSGAVDQSIEPGVEGWQSRLAVQVPADWTSITVTDKYGNVGTLTPPPPPGVR